MESNAFSFWSNVFGIVTGCVSLITLVVGFRSYLPSNRIKALESLIDDTEKIFRSAVEEGLLPELTFKTKANRCLSKLREKSLVLRSRASSITTLSQDCKELIMGLSSKIGDTCHQIKILRAEIITSSEAERRNIRNSRRATSPASLETRAAQPLDCASVDCTDDGSTSSTLAELPVDSDYQDTRCNTPLADADAVSDYRADATGQVLSLNMTDIDARGGRPTDAIETRTRDQTAEVVARITIPALRLDAYYTMGFETVPCDAPDPSGQQEIQLVVRAHR